MKHTIFTSALVGTALLVSAGAASAATVYATEIDAGRAGVAGVGFEATSQVNNTNRDDAGNALGAPDQVGNSEGGFYSLGLGGAAVFGFGTSFDIQANLFEVTFNCGGASAFGTCNNGFLEEVEVYALNGAYTAFDGEFDLSDLLGLGFSYVDTIGNGDANEAGGASIALSGPFTYLALVDQNGSGVDGFDVDAVSVSAVPLPASILFLLGGLGGLGFLRARKTA